MRRPFNATHANLNATFPTGSAARRKKIVGLTSCREQRWRILFWVCTEQERATAALLRVAWIWGKRKGVFEMIFDRKAEVMSLAVDKSSDSSDVTQLCLYVRFSDRERFHNDLLGLIALKGQNTIEHLICQNCSIL